MSAVSTTSCIVTHHSRPLNLPQPQTFAHISHLPPQILHPPRRLVKLPAHPPHGRHAAVEIGTVPDSHVLDGLLDMTLLLSQGTIRVIVAVRTDRSGGEAVAVLEGRAEDVDDARESVELFRRGEQVGIDFSGEKPFIVV